MSEFKPVTLTNLGRFLANLKERFVQIKNAVLSVNGITPDSDGDITVSRVNFAGDLESSSTLFNSGEYIARTAGGEASIQDGDAWMNVIRGRSVHTGYVDEIIDMTVNAMERENPITATINEAAFKTYVTESGTTTLTYTTGWSADPANYGVTVTGTPVAGDQIVIVYVKEERGLIAVSNPTSFVSTGWNLYNNTLGYARVLDYSDEYGFKISGTYTGLQFSATQTGARSSITVTDGNFTVPSDGYVWVSGGNSTDTAIWMTWEDWTEGYDTFSAYSQDTIDLSSLYESDNALPYGLCQVGSASDEINLNIGQVTRRIDRMEYTEPNRIDAESSGREYDFDENYIYIVLATPVTTGISIDGSYSVSDHGMEYFEGTSVPVYAQSIYGSSLKNKLERDVLTISQQTLTSAQQNQARANIDAAKNGDVFITFGTTSKTISANLTDYWQSYVPQTGTPVLVKISAQYGAWYGYLSLYDSGYGSGVITRYDGVVYSVYLNNGSVTIKTPISNVKEFAVNASSSKQLTLTNNARIEVITFGGAAAVCGRFEIFTSSTGAVVASTPTATGITLNTATTGKITISNTNSGVNTIVKLIIFDGNAT